MFWAGFETDLHIVEVEGRCAVDGVEVFAKAVELARTCINSLWHVLQLCAVPGLLLLVSWLIRWSLGSWRCNFSVNCFVMLWIEGNLKRYVKKCVALGAVIKLGCGRSGQEFQSLWRDELQAVIQNGTTSRPATRCLALEQSRRVS